MRGGRGGGGAGVRGEWLGGRKEVGEQEGGGEGRREVGVVVWVGAGRRGGGRGGEAAATPSTTPRQVALHSSAGPLLPAATPSMNPRQVTLHSSAGPLLPAATPSMTPRQVTLHSSAGPLLPAATPSMTPWQVTLHSSAGPLLPAATPSMTPWQVAPSYLQPAPPPKSRLLAAGVGPTRRRHEAAHQNPGQRVWPPQVMRVHAQRPCIHAIQVSGCGLHK